MMLHAGHDYDREFIMRTLHVLMSALFLLATTSVAAVANTTAKPATREFKDCADCPPMVVVPAGKFMMGISPEMEPSSRSHGVKGTAAPVHQVTFAKPFAIGKYPITVAEFRKFVEETNYKTPDSCYNQQLIDGHMIYENARGFSWRAPGYPITDKHPVVCITWEDATAYTIWLSKKTGRNYSLPTEAQYEYAARGGTTTLYFWGDKFDATACRYSNQADFAQGRAMGPDAPMGPEYRFQCDDGYAFTSPVGSYLPNPFGLYDMQGNIWEFTADCWNPNYVGAPTDGSAWMTGDCDANFTRGGSFGNASWTAHVAQRAARDRDFAGHSWGFRVARND